MTFDRVLGILGLLISLPSFLFLFFSPEVTSAALILLLGVVLGLGALYLRWLRLKPPFSMRSIAVELAVHDQEGARATLRKTYEAVANYDHFRTMDHRNIGADGSVSNLCWNGSPIPQSGIKRVLGEYQVTVEFPTPIARGTRFAGVLSYSIADSFPATNEALVYVADFKSPRVSVSISLPPTRPCKSAWAVKVEGAGKRTIEPGPSVSQDGTHIRLDLARPPVGSEYEIWWSW